MYISNVFTTNRWLMSLEHSLVMSRSILKCSTRMKIDCSKEKFLRWYSVPGKSRVPSSPIPKLLNVRVSLPFIRFYVPQKASAKDYYEILGVNRNATQEEIKSAYYELSKVYHPDIGKTGDDDDSRQFSDITEAYDILSNYELRKKYDKGLLHDISHLTKHHAGFQSKPIEKEDFYRSRMVKSASKYGTARPSIYDVDDWTKQQISSTFKKKKKEKEQQETGWQPGEDKGTPFQIIVTVFVLFILVMFLFFKPLEDYRKPPKKD